MFRIVMLVSVTVGLLACSHSPTQNTEFTPPPLHPNTASAYEAERARVMTQAPNSDFTRLRHSFTGTDAYQPWDTTEHEASIAMLNAQEDEDYTLCLRLADAILERNFVSLYGHFGAYACNQGLDHTDQAQFHGWMLKGLMDSITASGDGLSEDSAFIVLSGTEMRAFVRLSGLLMYRQENVFSGPRQLEVVYATDPAVNDDVVWYFDTSFARQKSFAAPSLP